MASQYKLPDNNESLLRKVIIDISRTIIRPWIKSMEYNFDSYWRELGLSFIIASEVSDRELIELRNELLCFFNQRYPNDEISFEWQATFERTEKIIEVLLPEDKLRDINDTLTDLSA